MGLYDKDFTRKMAMQSIIFAIFIFAAAIYVMINNFSFFGIDAFYYSLICSIVGGVQLIIAFDYYNNGAVERPFGLVPLYLTGAILGVIIFYLVILNITPDMIAQVMSTLKIEAVR
jgi:hypothetical protein